MLKSENHLLTLKLKGYAGGDRERGGKEQKKKVLKGYEKFCGLPEV